MTDEERIDLFLETFKELEKEVVSQSQIRDSDYVSFSRALNTCFHQKKNLILSDYDVYAFLRTASDIRNILSHEFDTCVPTESFIQQMKRVLHNIENPLNLFDIATKEIHSCRKEDPVKDIMEIMERYSISHLPVVNDKMHVVGVFSRSTIFDFFSEGGHPKAEMTIADFGDLIDLDKHHNESFLFAGKRSSIDDVFSYMAKRKPHQKHVACVFVTDNGSQNSKLRGILTLSDLASHYNEAELN